MKITGTVVFKEFSGGFKIIFTLILQVEERVIFGAYSL